MEKIKTALTDWLHNDNFERILIIGIALIIIFLAVRNIKKAISKRVSDTDKKYRARKVTNIFGYFLFVVVVLMLYSDKLGNIGLALGLAGAGIAFALQEVITSIAGWLSIMFSSTVKVGQRVKIGDIRGDIIDIAVLKTTIMEVGDWVQGDSYNGRITAISNSFVFKYPIQNYSADYPFLWDEIIVPIRTESDFKLAREVFTKVTFEICGEYAKKSAATWSKMRDKYRLENAQVDPLITLSFDQNWITFTLRYVVDYQRRRITKDLLFTRLLEEISKHDEIQIATSAMEVTNLDRQEGL